MLITLYELKKYVNNHGMCKFSIEKATFQHLFYSPDPAGSILAICDQPIAGTPGTCLSSSQRVRRDNLLETKRLRIAYYPLL